MKKITYLMLAFVLALFTQCSPNNGNNDEESKMLPVKFTVPIDGGKSDFTDFLTNPFTQNAIINWNSTGVETVYLAVPDVIIHSAEYGTDFINKCAQLVPLTAICDGSSELVFTGSIDSRIIHDGYAYTLYYFGNNGGEDIYREETSKIVGKTMSFDGQDGTRENLGNYHVACINVAVNAEYNNDNIAQSYNITSPYPKLSSMMSVALLDLDGESYLNGTAAIKSMSIMFDEESNEYKHSYSTETGLELNNTSSSAFIALCPSSQGSVLECSKGCHTFEKGIKANTVHYNYNTVTHKIEALDWE
ncbi:MAG: hypothetical protein IKW54_02940 [Bacteroidales bacterium]|nr:hypothetical protein [Bacteroidales bacterium]